MDLISLAAAAKKASRSVRTLTNEIRSKVLREFAYGLVENADTIIEAVVNSIEDCWQDGGLSEDGTGEPILMDKLYDLLMP